MASELTVLKNVGERRAQALGDAGLYTMSDLARFFPRAYRDNPDDIRPVSETCFDRHDVIEGRISGKIERVFFGKMCIVRAKISDASGSIVAVWYNQPWLAQQLHEGQTLKLYGRAEYKKGSSSKCSPRKSVPRPRQLEPLYKNIAGVPEDLLQNMDP